jgi:hypothetical protein
MQTTSQAGDPAEAHGVSLLEKNSQLPDSTRNTIQYHEASTAGEMHTVP